MAERTKERWKVVVVVVVVDRKVSGEFGGDGGLKEGKNTGSATKKKLL